MGTEMIVEYVRYRIADERRASFERAGEDVGGPA